MQIIQVIKHIFSLLNKEQKTRMLFLQVFFIFSALIQVVGVASIAPFIGIMSNPESIHTSTPLKYLYSITQAQSDQSFIIMFAVTSIIMIFTSNLVSAITLWLLLKFSVSVGSDLQFSLYNSFLKRDYL